MSEGIEELNRGGRAYVVAGSEGVDLNRVEASECKHALLRGDMRPSAWGAVGLQGGGDE